MSSPWKKEEEKQTQKNLTNEKYSLKTTKPKRGKYWREDLAIYALFCTVTLDGTSAFLKSYIALFVET